MGSQSTEDRLVNGKEFAGAKKKTMAYGIVDQQGKGEEETPSFDTYKGQQVYGDSFRQFADTEEETYFDFMREVGNNYNSIRLIVVTCTQKEKNI